MVMSLLCINLYITLVVTMAPLTFVVPEILDFKTPKIKDHGPNKVDFFQSYHVVSDHSLLL